MRLECEWRHARKRWSWECEDFEKHVSRGLTLDNVGRDLGCLPLRQLVEVEVEFRQWCWEVGVRPWCWKVGSDHGVEKLGPTMVLKSWVWPWCWKVGSDHGVEKLESDHGVEKLGLTMVLKSWVWPWCWKVGSDHGVEKLRTDHEICRAFGCCLHRMITKDF